MKDICEGREEFRTWESLLLYTFKESIARRAQGSDQQEVTMEKNVPLLTVTTGATIYSLQYGSTGRDGSHT